MKQNEKAIRLARVLGDIACGVHSISQQKGRDLRAAGLAYDKPVVYDDPKWNTTVLKVTPKGQAIWEAYVNAVRESIEHPEEFSTPQPEPEEPTPTPMTSSYFEPEPPG